MRRNPLGLPECPSCGGWGKGLTSGPGALCAHCSRARPTSFAPAQPLAGTKRPRAEEEEAAPAAPSDLDRLLATADAADVPQLDAAGVKRLVASLEKKAAKNQLQRAKFADEPARFLESEAELDEELKKLRVVAAAPEQYPTFLAAGALSTLSGLLAHENVDIATDAVALLEELTDEDAVAKGVDEDENEDEEDDEDTDAEAALGGFRREGVALARAVLDSCFGLVVAHGERLHAALVGTDGAEPDEDAEEGLAHVLGLLTNLLTLTPSTSGAALLAGSGTSSAAALPPMPRLAVALLRSRSANSAANGRAAAAPAVPSPSTLLAASEVVAMTLQSSVEVAASWGALSFGASASEPMNGTEVLLSLLNGYRRAPPAGAEDEETLANLFDALCACLLSPENRARFLAAEGLELMLRLIAAAGFARYGALKACSYALGCNPAACAAFVEAGGLKEAFPAFMGKGIAHTRKLHGAETCALEEEHAVNIVSLLLQWLPGGWGGVASTASGAGLARLRVLQKFKESANEKVDRLIELYHRCARGVADAAAEFEAAEGPEDADDDEEEAAARSDRRHLARLSGGLPTLQRVCFIIASLVTEEARATLAAASGSSQPAVAAAAAALAAEVAFATRRKLYEQGGSLLDVADVLAEHGQRLTEEEADAAGTAAGADASDAAAAGRAMHARLVAALTAAAGVVAP